MQIAFIADEITNFVKDHDSTWAIMQAAHEAGDSVYYGLASSLAINPQSNPVANFIEINKDFFEHQERSKSKLLEFTTRPYPEQIKLDDFDLIFMRKDPPVDVEYILNCQILALCKEAKLINNPNSIIKFNEKLSTLNFPKLIPTTLVSKNIIEIKNFLCEYKQIVIKPTDQMGGKGVFSIKINDENIDSLLETATNFETISVIIQEYLPIIKTQGDKRIIMINGKARGALLRIPPENDFRANLAAGGSYAKYQLNDSDLDICHALENFLIDNQIYLAGIDVIGKHLTEINISSPTCLQEINRMDNLSGENKLEAQLLRTIKSLSEAG